VEASFARAIERLHAAMADVANGDVRAIVALHSTRDDVTSFYGWGGYEKGHAAVVERWDWAGEQFKGGTVSYANLAAEAQGDLGYTVDIETFRARVGGGAEPVTWANRVTHIFRRENGEWRLVNRHASRLTERREPVG
jgi:ketosteroid isomerase-like protein